MIGVYTMSCCVFGVLDMFYVLSLYVCCEMFVCLVISTYEKHDVLEKFFKVFTVGKNWNKENM